MAKPPSSENAKSTAESLRVIAADEIDVAVEIERLKRIGDLVLSKAKSQGAHQVEVGVSKDLGLSVQVRNQDVETLEYNRDNSFGLTVYFDQRKGTASTSDLSDEAILAAVEAACNIAKYTEKDPFAGLADAELMAKNPRDLDLDHPMGITAEQAKALALRCEQAGLSLCQQAQGGKKLQSEGATFSSHRNIRYYANSHGFAAATPSTRHSLSSVFIAQNAQGMQRDYWYGISRNAQDLESPQSIGQKAAERALARGDARKIATGKAPVLMVPEIARGLINNLCAGIRGANLYRKSSFLLGALGQPIFPEFFQLQEKPFIPGGLGSSWFDSEGLATKEQFLVENGVLKTYLLNSYSARKLAMKPTGHAGGVHNLHLTPMNLDQQALIKQMGRGLLVTDVMGHGVNLVNGDYSRGASGFWVENGEIQHFVEEVTIAGNLKDMFANLVAVGNDLDHRSSVLTGSWLLEEMTIAGQ